MHARKEYEKCLVYKLKWLVAVDIYQLSYDGGQ